ncbi:MAG: hypothetical protein K8I82_29915, partial [Anaerolineae bacterium]|nr:hypothetical protein [Anaerolineae bacterium]
MNDITMFVYFLSNLLTGSLGILVIGAVFVAKNRPPAQGIVIGAAVGVFGLVLMVMLALSDDLSNGNAIGLLLAQVVVIMVLGVAAYYSLPPQSAEGQNVIISTRVDKVGFWPFVRRTLRAEIAVFV